MTASERVTVVIPNWNGRKFIGECLDALAAQSQGRPAVIVVDNGSSDGSSEFIGSNYPWVNLIPLPSNEGFSRAVNRGIKAAGAPFVALLNNDAVPDPEWISELLRAMDSFPEAGSCASKVVFHDDPSTIDSAGDQYAPWGMVFNRGHGEPDDGRFDSPAFVFGPCASAALYRKSLFDEIGLFDENFFAYYEDTDVNFRAVLASHPCVYVPSARVRHRYSASSSGKSSKLGTEEVYIHLTGVLLKNMPGALLLKHAISISAVHSAILLFFIVARLRGKNRLPHVPLAKFMFAMLRQRTSTGKSRRATIPEIENLFCYRDFPSFLLKKQRGGVRLLEKQP
ncbi:MAG TPA: glycosyltransferase family 2 protein [bacterium]|nr:glycosyltransferase family 2 protein [bacterium]